MTRLAIEQGASAHYRSAWASVHQSFGAHSYNGVGSKDETQ